MVRNWPSDRVKRGDEGERLEKCRKCLAYYYRIYALSAGGHRCDPLIREMVKMVKRKRRLR